MLRAACLPVAGSDDAGDDRRGLVVARTLEAWRPRPSKRENAKLWVWREKDELVGFDPFGWLDGESRDVRPDADPGTIAGCLNDEALELIVTGVLALGVSRQ